MNILKELMKKKNLRQTDIAHMVGVSNVTVSEWVRNRKDPRGENLRKLCEILDVDELVLLGALSQDTAALLQDECIPKTAEARILSAGIDKMPEKERERALTIMRIMFEQYADYFERNGDND